MDSVFQGLVGQVWLSYEVSVVLFKDLLRNILCQVQYTISCTSKLVGVDLKCPHHTHKNKV